MVVQTYKSIFDYKAGYYPHYPYDPSRKIYPVIVTLEDWFLIGPKLANKLKADVLRRLEQAALPIAIVDEMPYSVCAIHEFEPAIQVMDRAGIHTVMQRKIEKSRQEWTLAAFLRDGFQEHWDQAGFLFEKEFDSIEISVLGDWSLHT